MSLFGVLAPWAVLGGLSSVGILAIESVGAQVAPLQTQAPPPQTQAPPPVVVPPTASPAPPAAPAPAQPPPSAPPVAPAPLPPPPLPPAPAAPPAAVAPPEPAPMAPAPAVAPPPPSAPPEPAPMSPAPVNTLDASSLEVPPNSPDEEQVPLRWPYFDLEYGGVKLDNRYQTYGVVWVHGGAYFWERLHLTGRVGVAQANVREQSEQATPLGFSPQMADEEDLPHVFGNLGLGYVFTSNGSFVLAPSLTLQLSENLDYGYGAGVMIPFVWVTRRGFRVGFQASLLRAFGGSVRFTCTATQVDAPCDAGEVREFNRASGSGFSGGFIFGYGAG